MPAGLWPVLTGVPSTRRWDFGDCPYGLEPLTLPPAGVWHPAQATQTWRPPVPGTPGGVSLVGDYAAPTELGGAVPDSSPPAAELFWFRWITGHQVSFILWRLIGQVIHDADEGDLEPGTAIAALRTYVHGYCGMLLYTGSCPSRTYAALIRPSMRLRHPAFSGAWAPDFWPIRDLLRGRRVPFAGVPGAATVTEAVKLHQVVHEVVAARLVADGRSLLRQSTVRARETSILHLLYDNFFITVRGMVGYDAVVGQLLRRLVAISRDLHVNGLYPQRDAHADAGECHPGVAACEAGIATTLHDVASTVMRAPRVMANAQPAF
jgi:hypothetical protein